MQGNETAVVEFIILGFRSIPEVQFILFFIFLVTYITTVLGNLLIMVLVLTDHHLHNPICCCLQLLGGSWVNGLLVSAIVTSLMPQLTFCGPNEIDHFFCDFTPVVMISCSDTHWIELVKFILAFLLTLPPFLLTLPPFLLTLISYVYISSTVLRIPSFTGGHKAFSTSSFHLTVVTLFYGAPIVVCLVPKINTLEDFHQVFSVCYTVLTPLVNPLIYILRNNNIKKALRTVLN